MGRNSIKESLGKEDIISSIRLYLGADIRKECVFIVVEGQSDESFLINHVCDNVNIIESYCGKAGVESIVEEFSAENDRVIGIRDRDYQEKPVSPKIFYYDYCCMEMMVFRSDRVFGRIYAEYFARKGSFLELRRYVLEQLKYVSVARKLNERNKWGISFKNCSISASWDDESRCVDRSVLLRKLREMNKGLPNEEMARKIEDECKADWIEEDFFFNTQGHDFSGLLALVCRKYGNLKKGISGEEIERGGRLAYSESDFAKSRLCRELSEYGESCGVQICKAAVGEQGSDEG